MISTSTTQIKRIRIGLWMLVAVVTLVLGGNYLFETGGFRRVVASTPFGEAAIHSKFTLIDQKGNRVTETDFVRRWQLVFFGFTHCPDICPTTLAYMAEVLDRLGEKHIKRVAPIFITVDPSRDTPQVMAEYAKAFHPDIIGLSGTEAQINSAAQAFRVYYEKFDEAEAPDGYVMVHARHIYLMTPEGRFERVFREGEQSAQEMASEIATLTTRN